MLINLPSKLYKYYAEKEFLMTIFSPVQQGTGFLVNELSNLNALSSFDNYAYHSSQ